MTQKSTAFAGTKRRIHRRRTHCPGADQIAGYIAAEHTAQGRIKSPDTSPPSTLPRGGSNRRIQHRRTHCPGADQIAGYSTAEHTAQGRIKSPDTAPPNTRFFIRMEKGTGASVIHSTSTAPAISIYCQNLDLTPDTTPPQTEFYFLFSPAFGNNYLRSRSDRPDK